MKINNLLIHLSILLIFSLPSPSSSERCNPQDKKALLQVKNELNNPFDLQLWDRKTDCCSDWSLDELVTVRLFCDTKTNRINNVDMILDEASQIPPSLGNLKYLRSLRFISVTNHTRTIPESFTKLKHLTSLTLVNNLSGPIPSFLSKMKTLEYLDLSYNSFTGSIPASFSQLPRLTVLYIRKNQLTGTIPKSITQLKNLQKFEIFSNNLSGPIPSFLSKIKSLIYLDLSSNAFTGSIPSSLFELPNLATLNLEQNQLTGNIPESLGTGVNRPVLNLDLSHNQLTGEVPKSFGNSDFGLLKLSSNKLVGDVSFLFGTNKTLFTVDLSRNLFKFDLSKIKFPKQMGYFDVNHNKIFGKLPIEMTGLNMYGFNVSYNRLCGEIPVGGRLQSYEATAYSHNLCLCGSPLPPCK